MDDLNNTSKIDLWSVFYDLYINPPTLEAIRAQAKKLQVLSKDMQSWTKSSYNTILRIVNTDTLQSLHEYWSKYASFTDPDRRKYITFRHQCKDFYFITPRYSASQGLQMNARSFGPRIANTSKMTEYYVNQWWKHGRVDKVIGTDLNPLFLYSSCGGDKFSMHYRTNPLNGYHLAAGVTEMTRESPYYFPRQGTLRDNVLDAAKRQFRLWCDAFRRAVKRAQTEKDKGSLRIRFYCGDAVNFCLALKCYRDDKTSAINLYSRPWSVAPITFDGDNYLPDAIEAAPLSFNVIECSNTSDEVGFTNLMTSTIPLLEPAASSVIYTETMRGYPPPEEQSSLLEELCLTKMTTMLTLLGVIPTSYVCGFTTRDRDEAFMDEANPTLNRINWRLSSGLDPALPKIKLGCDPEALANVLLEVYLEMFVFESIAYFERMLQSTPYGRFRCPQPRYTRASFVQFLAYLRSRVSVDWNALMSHLCRLIETDEKLMLGPNSIRDFYLQLHLRGLYDRFPFGETMQSLRNVPSFPTLSSYRHSEGILRYADPPMTTCLIITIPRRKLKIVYNACVDSGQRMNMIFQIHIMSKGEANTFSSVHPVFGKLSTRDDICTITRDLKGWFGQSDLHLCIYVPTFLLLMPHPKDVDISVRFQPEMGTMLLLRDHLGIELEFFRARLLSSEYVHLVKCMPNLEIPNPISVIIDASLALSNEIVEITQPTFTPADQSFTTRITIKGTAEKKVLKDGANVEFVQSSLCSVKVRFGSFETKCDFPMPVVREMTKIRIARKSSWIEVIAHALKPQIKGMSNIQRPLSLIRSTDGLVSWGLPYVNFKSLSRIAPSEYKRMWDLWLKGHLDGMYSDHECEEKSRTTLHEVKKSIDSMFQCLAESNGKDPRAFALIPQYPTGEALQFYLTGLYLDNDTNSVVLSAYVVYEKLEKLPNGIYAIRTPWSPSQKKNDVLQELPIKEDVYSFWKAALPALAERCRDYAHTKTCSYHDTSHEIETICGCGTDHIGSDLKEVKESVWESAAHEANATRIAVSPLFAAPYLEPARGGPMSTSYRQTKEKPLEAPKKTAGRRRRISSSSPPPPPPPSFPPPPIILCDVCGKKGGKKCGSCGNAIYCSRECQKQDWKNHRSACQAFREQQQAAQIA